ncbi:hypothetical protein [Stratiformator vulcanicus]|uniref:Uncharacterized protein n=1 Tax=Stratiformator vulcanicus TaxID=2527980 RepID=A0A517QVM1_9PLAN|nr:hypothetical protein [Stratiformator vulcanicus]QDT35705.1 hypothetical protein Pan189_00580 [Stratiformator vulcanicus]
MWSPDPGETDANRGNIYKMFRGVEENWINWVQIRYQSALISKLTSPLLPPFPFRLRGQSDLHGIVA